MYTVTFVGLNYFNACTDEQKEALIPNGTTGDGHVPQHNASLFIEASQLGSDNWWPEQKYTHPIKLEVKIGEFRTVDVLEFRIPQKVGLNFRCEDTTLNNVNLDKGLPKLQDVPGFVLDDHPDTIANIPLPGGALEVCRFGSSALVRWTISEHQEPITITAFADEEKRRVTLKESDPQLPTEIVFSNTVDLLNDNSSQGVSGQVSVNTSGAMAGMPVSMPVAAMPAGGMPAVGMPGMHGSGHGYAGHFVLYAKLDKARDESKFENPKLPDFLPLASLPFSHPYLAFLSSLEEIPDPPCVPSCCGKGGN